MKFTFKKPYVFEGKEYTELDLDLESLNGGDIIQVHKEYSDAGNFVMIPATDWGFCARVAAKALKQPYEFLERMPANEYCRLAQAVSNFLLI